MSNLLRLLLIFLCPMADDPEPPEPEAEVEAEEPADEPDIEAAADEPEAEPDPVAKFKEVETTLRETQEQMRQLQAQARQRPDPTMDEEERKLRDPNTSELEKWQINSNRALRSSAAQSQQALFQAQDMADKTTYQVKAASNPLYSKYEKRVDEELAKARQSGANPTREFILDILVGRDMRMGNFKSAPAVAGKGKVISRGKPTGARSDTPSRGGTSEREKRAARLANIQI